MFLVLDPAWKADSGGGGKGANEQYDLHDVDAMSWEYRRSEPWRDVGPAIMFMWATTSAHRCGDDRALVRALGFTQSAEFIWDKVGLVDNGAFVPRSPPGIGQWQFCDHEYLLLCKRGLRVDLPLPIRPRSVIHAPAAGHSVKPEEAWSQVIEVVKRQVMPDVRGIEYNARVRRKGWDAVGRLTERREHGPIVYVRGED